MSVFAGMNPIDRRAVRSWISYDWAISAFNTLVGTFIYNAYFARSFAPNEDLGMALWSRGVVISALLIALLSPVLGAVADRSGRRRQYMILMTLVCAGATALLTFVAPSDSHAVLKALTIIWSSRTRSWPSWGEESPPPANLGGFRFARP